MLFDCDHRLKTPLIESPIGHDVKMTISYGGCSASYYVAFTSFEIVSKNPQKSKIF